jgi:menaquinol-cytochrome c reductase iron-sulfur subunit
MSTDKNPENTSSPNRSSELEFPGRRSFFGVLTAVGTSMVGALLAVPLTRFALFPLLKPTPDTSWTDAGPASNFAQISDPEETQIEVRQRDGWRESVSEKSVYVLPPDNGENRVLSTICPHLGCHVQWQKDNRRFFCPCHGSQFAPDGSLIQGPATRGMDQLECRVEKGKLMVLYQYFRLLVSNKEPVE